MKVRAKTQAEGSSTESMTWITPFVQAMSVVKTLTSPYSFMSSVVLIFNPAPELGDVIQ